MVTAAMLALAFAAAQAPTCVGAGAVLRDEAEARVEAFDLQGGADRLTRAVAAGCPAAREAALYLEGLLALRDAARVGGSDASLIPVRRVVGELEAIAGGAPGSADVARAVLLAGMAAAQTERDEMWLWLEQALALEVVQREAGESGAPLLTAHEVAGELWLQVHRYEDARRFFARAAAEVGRTPRVTLGLARTAARLEDVVSACREYATFVWWWGTREGAPVELTEARTYLAQAVCHPFTGQTGLRQ